MAVTMSRPLYAGSEAVPERSPERVDLGDGRWTYAIADADVPTEVLFEGALAWRYVGQAVFSSEAAGLPEVIEWVVPEYSLVGMAADPVTYFGVGHAQRLDDLGRLWVLDAVDVEEANEKRRAYDDRVADEFGVEEGPVAEAGWLRNPMAGETLTLTPLSHSRWNCPAEPDATAYIVNRDGFELTEVTAPMPALDRQVLLLAREGESCSGVMISDEWMLTNAHCTNPRFDDEGNWLRQVWCTMENLDENTSGSTQATCSRWNVLIRAPGWDVESQTPPDQDYALVRLADPPDVGWMPISNLSDGELSIQQHHIRGYPRSETDCTDTAVTNNALTTVDTYTLPGGDVADLHGRDLVKASGTSVTITPTFVELNTSVAKGTSGGPHFYLTGQPVFRRLSVLNAYLRSSGCTGTTNPFACSSGGASGPKGPAFRDWVIAIAH